MAGKIENVVWKMLKYENELFKSKRTPLCTKLSILNVIVRV